MTRRFLLLATTSALLILSTPLHHDAVVIADTHPSIPGWELSETDASLPLTTEPLVFSTFIGSSGDDVVTDMVIRTPSGEMVIVGYTDPAGEMPFPTTAGAFQDTLTGLVDAFVALLSADGSTLLASTLLGSSSNDYAYAVAVGPSGEVTVTGKTFSNSFPTTPGAYQEDGGVAGDVFVTRFDPTLSSLVYSTFIGGFGMDWAAGIALDSPSGEVVLAGYANGLGFPTTPGAFDESHNGQQDVFVARLSGAGDALVFSTYLGGLAMEGWGATGATRSEDHTIDVALDDNGRATVVGMTRSADFPTTPAAYDLSHNAGADVFVARLNAAGSALDYSTFVGGDLWEAPMALAVDELGRPTFGGFTYSTGFPTTPGAYDESHNGGTTDFNDAFVTRLDATGSTLLYSTFLGGITYESVRDLALCPVTGDTFATGFCNALFPTTPDAYDDFPNRQEAFVSRLRMAGGGESDLVYSTFLGGELGEAGSALAVDCDGAVVAGATSSLEFPTTDGAYNPVYTGGDRDGFVTRLSIPTCPAAVDEGPDVVTSRPRVLLSQALPNPTLGRVSYSIDVRSAARVRVSVFDAQGRLIARLFDDWLAAGAHRFDWDPRAGRDALASGTYYLLLDGAGVQQSRKVVLLR